MWPDLSGDLEGERLDEAFFGDLELEGLCEVVFDLVGEEELALRGRKGGGSSAGSIAGADGSRGEGIARNM